MSNKNEKENPLFFYEMVSQISRLEYQKDRIFKELKNQSYNPEFILAIHEADYYMVLLRRIYREIEKLTRHDSEVANFKGRNINLVKKIKIRDHFEHGVDFSKINGSFKIVTSIMDNKIVSGNFVWNLQEDHQKFIEMINDMLKF